MAAKGRRIRKKQLRNTDSVPSGFLTDKADVISVKKALDAYSNPAANLGVGSNI